MALTTMLFVPADRPERFEKAAASTADAVVLDLEDAVAPENKEIARANVVKAALHKRTFVRVNPVQTEVFLDDLLALARAGCGNVMLPKAEAIWELERVAAALGEDITIIPLIETAVGLDNARELAAHRTVPFVAFGSLDFALDMGCEHTQEALRFARQTLVFASRLAQKAAPIDGVTVAIDDYELIKAEATEARHLGFGGKLVIHPKQLAAVAEAFHPSDAEIAWATQVVEAVSANGTRAAKINGQMIDKPVMSRAEKILSRTSPTRG
ncbi:HpcH/HpaI aldolase/citrate lyase family protein [Rhizobium leguminosarum]|jgi:citrate lyase subunit beta/citryl-CoA lyase|uniref:HpcH/HpaI aldolase/citrate lyase family protein n=1 Tax=Rhizobium leguminosarum TaxID=384 RepID=UPI00103A31AE|nr:CoA ester lyase [Rhizobium leguminosarum]MBY5329885.1 CoA ester lyase [Rhizobium leguminosarum]MBY5475076.1 CoA ester lyase [Rhizobium leguminosarum]MBY5494426.1 CoA ester lyase [Rhizobium leguminosarum]TCA34689.1 CoA ester lyase [Rhizobium leguminosarum bv. viciae]TCA49174.1 CoA ester lyase [Rhizobium leguminosarum bv. viciae]